ncbi:MAG: helix-turn-helix domain-containing protein [Eubacteriaceae bacterium]|nr:helix-turn-helix domain-containing protein [Eubacteriaceae bacterium]
MASEDRQEIHECLDNGMTFKAIAKRIGKDQTTVSKEEGKHMGIRPYIIKPSNADGPPAVEKQRPLLLRAPYVCNSCV